MIASAKIIGSGIATIGLAGAGEGVNKPIRGIRFFSIKKDRKEDIKNIIRNIRTGINHTKNLDLLPKRWNKIHNHIIMRAIRVITGLITIIGLINLNHKVINVHGYDLEIYRIMLVFFSYTTMVSLTKLLYICKIIINREYEVRNSPLNTIASQASLVVYCIKGVCIFIATSGSLLGGLVVYDSVLERTGRERTAL